MARSIGTRYPRGGSNQWIGPNPGAVVLDDAFFGTEAPTTIEGTLSATLADATLVATGTLPASGITGELTATLGAATLASTGTLRIAGTLTGTLGAATLSATGVLGALPAITGELSATLGDATLVATGEGPAPEPSGLPSGGWNKWGYLEAPRKKERREDAEIVAEILQAATEPVFRKPPAPKPIKAFVPEPVRIDESAVLSVMDKARREWMERDEDDAIALAIILANA
jgi:hypothetical protein